MCIHVKLAVAALIAWAALPLQARAYSFVPTELEWATWPQYCKARYNTTETGERQRWRDELSRAQIETQRSIVGPATFVHVHHYCAGLAWMMRARLEGNGAKRKLLWDSANSEVTYTFERIPKTSPIYAVIATNLASIRKELGRPAEAVGYATQAIEANPHNYQAYIGLALIYRSLNEPEKARDTLLAGDAAVNGESSEIHYNLGLLFFELGELDSALLYAKKAYANEYPLPGLKNKLEAAGHWSE